MIIDHVCKNKTHQDDVIFIDFILCCINKNYEDRMSADNLLNHLFIKYDTLLIKNALMSTLKNAVPEYLFICLEIIHSDQT